MNKRDFISGTGALLFGLAKTATAGAATANTVEAEAILTLTGAITRTNRGKLDPVSDQLMHKHGVHFERAFQFTLADLRKLPATTIRPTMEYDQKVHTLSGPRLLDVLNVPGISQNSVSKFVLRGIDGYSPEVTMDQAKQYNFILATHFDGALLHIGGFGPLFAIYDADRIAEFAQKPVEQRFPLCPWGLYCIEVG